MDFGTVCNKYEETFGEKPPMLATLSPENKEYINALINAIEDKEELTLNDLAEIFMQDKEALY